MLRNRWKYPTYAPLDSIRYWNRNWFYHKNLEIEGKASGLPKFMDRPAQVLDSWKSCVDIDAHQDLLTMARRIGKLVDSGLHGSDITLSWLKRRIQPLQFRTRLLYQFTGMTDPMCVTPASLPNDSVSRRIRQLMKIQKPCSDVEPAIDAYSAQNECPRVISWLIKHHAFFALSCILTFALSHHSWSHWVRTSMETGKNPSRSPRRRPRPRRPRRRKETKRKK